MKTGFFFLKKEINNMILCCLIKPGLLKRILNITLYVQINSCIYIESINDGLFWQITHFK